MKITHQFSKLQTHTCCQPAAFLTHKNKIDIAELNRKKWIKSSALKSTNKKKA